MWHSVETRLPCVYCRVSVMRSGCRMLPPNLAPQWQHFLSSESPLAIMKTASRRRQTQMVQLNVSVSTISLIRKSTVFLMIKALMALDEGIHNTCRQCKQFSCHFTLSDYSYIRYSWIQKRSSPRCWVTRSAFLIRNPVATRWLCQFAPASSTLS